MRRLLEYGLYRILAFLVPLLPRPALVCPALRVGSL